MPRSKVKQTTTAAESSEPPTIPGGTTVPADDDPLRLEVDGLTYTLDRPPSKSGKKVVVSIKLTGSDAPPFLDSANLYAFRMRHALATTIAEHFGRQTGDVMGHLALLLDQAERAKVTSERPKPVILTRERKDAAEKLLRAPNLIDLVARAMESFGHVGEENVRLLGFLISVSRFLGKPLSALLLAPPAAGKSAVLDAVRALTPVEQVVASSRLTAGALYYTGEDVLRHKLVVVDEFDGQLEAAHAIRVLQSAGSLTLTATLRGKAESFTVHGPIAVMSGSVSTTLDLQNTSRCVELYLDDSAEQTKKVQSAQAKAWAGLGPKPVDVQPWHDAMRLLADDLPAQVVIPYAPSIAFPAETTTDRRASAKMLGLVAASAVFHSRQRERDGDGKIVATRADYALVYKLLRPVVEAQLAGLSDHATTIYRALASGGVKTITRREAAALIGAAYMTAARALDELLSQELLQEVGHEKPRKYRLLDGSLLGRGAILTPPESLA